MDHQWYVGESSYAMPLTSPGAETEEASFKSASPWLLANQIREVLGEAGELDPSFFEEGWASGVPMGLDAVRGRIAQVAAPTTEGVTLAELSSFGGLFFTQDNAWPGVSVPYACGARATDLYAADWLRDTRREDSSWAQDQYAQSDDQGKQGDVPTAARSMTYRRACELLCVGEDSNEAKIRTAYRRRVSEWHPDRHEQSGETVRAVATRQMAAINEAYQFLRSSLCAASS